MESDEFCFVSSLDDNNIGDAGAKDIAAALEVNTTLETLV